MEDFKDPTSGMKFDSTEFDKALKKTRDSFTSTITDASQQAGMAAGASGMNVNRVTADTYSRAMSERDKSEANITGQLATAKSQFDTQKQTMSANARADYEKNKPGFLDWLQGGVTLAGGIVAATNPLTAAGSPGMIMGGLKGLGNAMSAYKVPGMSTAIGKPTYNPSTTTTTSSTDYANSNVTNSGFKFQNYDWGFKPKQSTKSTFNWGLK